VNGQLSERKEALSRDPKARLRWRILRGFGVLPNERRGRRLSDEDLIDCALHMVIDREKKPIQGASSFFDEAEFDRQKGGEAP